GEYLHLAADDCGITSLPLHYSYGLSVLHSHLAAGAALLLTERSVNDPALAAFARAERVTTLSLVPHQVDLMLAQQADFSAFAHLRRVTQAGGRLAPQTVTRMARIGAATGFDFIVMYGQTEAAPRMAWLPAPLAEANPDCIGQPIPGGTLSLRGPDGLPVTGRGIPGELIYTGPNVMLGYALVRDDLAKGREVDALATGDIAERTGDGLYRIVGRASRFAKLFGLRISLDQVEALLADRGLAAYGTALDDALAVQLTGSFDGDEVCALIAHRYGLPLASVRALPLARVPLLPSGKTDRRALDEMARAALAEASPGARHVDLAAAFRAATRSRHVGPDDSYAGLGGDSLGYLHAVLAIEERLGYVPDGWERLSISELEALGPRPRSRMTLVETSTLIRAIAISLVVIFHLTFWPVSGGTLALVILMGYSLAQFHRETIRSGNWRRILTSLLIPILPVYYLLLASFHLLREPIPPEMYLLIGNIPRRLDAPLFEPYWFISLYAQLVLVVALLAALPVVRRLISRDSFRFAMGAAVVCSVLSVLFQTVWLDVAVPVLPQEDGIGPNPQRTLPVALPFLFLGWAVFSARSLEERLATIPLLLVVLFVFPAWTVNHLGIAGGTAIALLFLPGVPLPARLAWIARKLAAATMFVYLVHNAFIHVAKHATDLHDRLGNLLSLALVLPACFLAGLILKAALDHSVVLQHRLRARLQSRPRLS
ncbi:MAG: Long-chain-fatty-acid--CoA ligase, partial [Pseudomonadota bacterium]